MSVVRNRAAASGFAREWSVMEASNPSEAIKAVGIRLPMLRGRWMCGVANRDGFGCCRPPRHTGRHAAVLADGDLVAVWP